MFSSPFAIRATTCCALLLTLQNGPSAFANSLVPGTLAKDSANSPSLHIAVLEGDKGVNVIRKKTTAPPVVQVLDQNDQPVLGAAVTFYAPGDGASVVFGEGSRSTTVMTEADGKASPVGGVPLNAGDFSYEITAIFHDMRATATVNQTNVVSQGQSAGTSTGATNVGEHSSHKALWIVAGAVAAAAVGFGVGLSHTNGGGSASTTPTATIGAGTGVVVSGAH